MVKITTICHNPESNVVRCPLADHPFSRAREFQRAFTAVKLNKIFAKPFLGALTGHTDGISTINKCPNSLNKIISGSFDGEIRLWDLTERKCLMATYQHKQAVKGVAFNSMGTMFLSSAADRTIHLYDFNSILTQLDESDVAYNNVRVEPVTKYLSGPIVGNVEHCPNEAQFVTAGDCVQVWSYERTKPISKLQWGVDSVLKVKYNVSDPRILCGTGLDRSIVLFDLRMETAVQRVFLPNKSNAICFNPMEPINFTVGSDDANCYSFDVRRMEKARTIHKDHVAAVTDLDYSPTGRQFVTGSSDRTVRIFPYDTGRSREVYHTKRMQNISSVAYTMDANYVLSGKLQSGTRVNMGYLFKVIQFNQRIFLILTLPH